MEVLSYFSFAYYLLDWWCSCVCYFHVSFVDSCQFQLSGCLWRKELFLDKQLQRVEQEWAWDNVCRTWFLLMPQMALYSRSNISRTFWAGYINISLWNVFLFFYCRILNSIFLPIFIFWNLCLYNRFKAMEP